MGFQSHFRTLKFDFEWTRMSVMFMWENTPIKEGTALPGSHTIISLRPTQTLTKGMNQTKALGKGRNGRVCMCVRACACRHMHVCKSVYAYTQVCVECMQ